MSTDLTPRQVALQLRQLADQLDPPPAPSDELHEFLDRELVRDLLRTAGMREPHLTRMANTKDLDAIIAWLDYLVRTDYPAEHRIGYLIKRLDANDTPPAGPQGLDIERILPSRPRRLR